MPRSALQFDEIRKETRKAILEAALVEFGERGFATATMADVARRAGISKGLIYNHFASKDDLLVSVITSRAEQVRSEEEAEENACGSCSRAERLEHVLTQKIRRVLEQAPLNRLFFALLLQPSTSVVMARVQAATQPAAERSLLQLMEHFEHPGSSSDSRAQQTAVLDASLFQMALNGLAFMLLIRSDVTPESLHLDALRKRLAERFAAELPTPEGEIQ